MIQRTIATWQDLSWQEELKQLITCPTTLIKKLKLDPELIGPAETASALFPLRVTPSFVARMKLGDPNDPLLKQVLPIGAEHHNPDGYTPDPLQEADFNTQKGIVHKYKNRLLLISTGSCAINCRYCFRRSFNYDNNRTARSEWQQTLDYIAGKPELDEIIFSGGDPLMQADTYFANNIATLAEIPHIERVRLHSRLPIVLPSRITSGLLSAFTQTRLEATWVVHANHAQEIDSHVEQALAQAHQAGITLLNQSVLLKGVNDNLTSQINLSKHLFKNKVLPYYLHALDKVSGIAHFDLSQSEVNSLYNAMRASLSGYLLPRLVREEPGKYAKTPLAT